VTQFLPGSAGAMAGAVTAVVAEAVGVASSLDVGVAIATVGGTGTPHSRLSTPVLMTINPRPAPEL